MTGRSSQSSDTGCPPRSRLRGVPVGQAEGRPARAAVEERRAPAPPRPRGPPSAHAPPSALRPVRIRSSAGAQADEPRQPLRAARAGDEPELHLGQAEDRLRDRRRRRGSGRRAPSRGRRPCSDPWMAATTGHGQRPPAGRAAPGRRARASRPRSRCGWREVLDVRAGDEVVGLAAADDHGPHGRPASPSRPGARRTPPSSPCRACSPARRARRGSAPGRRPGRSRARGTARRRSGTVSGITTGALTAPAPSRSPCRPARRPTAGRNLPFRRFSSLARVVVIRAPVAPNGWPMAIEPPQTLRRERSTFPTGVGAPELLLRPQPATPGPGCSRPPAPRTPRASR